MTRPTIVEDDQTSTRASDAGERVGSLLHGKWRLDALIAVGGMGAVYEATHRNGMRGAVKVLDPVLGRASGLRSRFLREGKLANRVQHDGAVRVLDDDVSDDGSAYLVMELLRGATLEALAAKAGGKLDPVKVVEYGLQVIDTLSAAAACGVVHRDIKPDNLFLTTDGVVKVLDFGIAGMLVEDGSMRSTRSGESFGTPAFMPPEQARGRWELVDHQSDLYSFGATLFTLLTGRIVYAHAGTVAELMVLSITEDPPSLRTLMPDAPDALVRAIDRSLKRGKAERWLDAAEMRAALEEARSALIAGPELTAGSERVKERAFEHQRMPTIAEWRMPLIDWRQMPRIGWLIAALALTGIVGVAFALPATTESTSLSLEHDVSEQTSSVMVMTSASAPVATLAPPIVATPRTVPASSSAPTPRPPTQSRYTAIYDRRY